MHFIGPFGVLGNLLVVRSPLFEMDEVKALRQQAVHIACNGAMILHDSRRYPLGHAPTLMKIIVDGPHLGAVRIGSPPRMPRGGEEWVLDGKDHPLEGSCQEAILLPHTTFDSFSVAFHSVHSTIYRPSWTHPCFHIRGVGFEAPHQPPIRIKAS